MTPATWATIIAAILIGGTGLGLVASIGWRRSLTVPAQWRSIAYAYGTAIILLVMLIRAAVAGDWAALGDQLIASLICGAITIGTHASHAWQDNAPRRRAHKDGNGGH